MIEIHNLKKIYKTPTQNITALENINFTINKGEIFGIIGLSGAGKSTLVRCINMLEKPTEGNIIINGQDITSLQEKELRLVRQKIGMIFQHFNLLSSRNVFNNILFPLEIAGIPRKNALEKAERLLALVDLADKKNAFPNQLSGGQKQRVGIARALASNPQVLLSDEATSALDPQTTKSILKLLKNINKQFNLTIVIITHDMNVIKEVCDRVAVINNSQIVEIGDVLDVFTHPKTETAYNFIKSVMNKEIPQELLQRSNHSPNKNSKLVSVTFIGSSAAEPVISSMVQKYHIQANILYGAIDMVKNTPFGNLTLELIGDASFLDKAEDYLCSQGLKVEVLKNA